MNYKDLGYDDNLSSTTNSPDFKGVSSLNWLEGIDASQISTLGRITSSDGQFYIDFDKNHIEVDSVSMDKLSTGTISVIGNLGDENIQLDGENKRILINDGTNDRILIGYQQDGF